MEDWAKFILGIGALILGIPIGNYLARITKEELKQGRLWFKIIIIISLIGAVISLILRIDSLLFTFLFISIVTSRSLKKEKGRRK